MAGCLTSLLIAAVFSLGVHCAEFEFEQKDGVIQGTGQTVGYGTLEEEWRGEVIHLSWSPRLYLLKNFLTAEECEHLIEKGESSLSNSTVVDNRTGRPVPSSARTSAGTFIGRDLDAVVSRVEERVARVTMLPKSHQETIQILRYKLGQEYKPHFDFLHNKELIDDYNGGQRVITVLMYLSTPLEGGETVFPRAEQKVSGPDWSDCAKQGYAVKAVKGDAVMFYSLRPDGITDDVSLHGSCPTLAGEKWSATIWVHVKPHRVFSRLPPFLLRSREGG